MRIRFEVQSLFSLGVGTHRLPINCWRLTVQYQCNFHSSVLLDGVSFFQDLVDVAATPSTHLAQFAVGGIRMPDGTPVNLDQVLTVTTPVDGRHARGMLIYEYLEP